MHPKYGEGMSEVIIMRTNGTEELIYSKYRGMKLNRWISATIDAETTDTVNLRDGRVMIIDDHGYEVEEIHSEQGITLKPVKALKPVNETATKIYHALCKPGTTHQIVGDVAIAWDKDFEDL